MEIIGEVKRVSQRKTASLDQVYQLVIETDNPTVLDLGKLPADVTVKVTVDINE